MKEKKKKIKGETGETQFETMYNGKQLIKLIVKRNIIQ